MLRFGLITEGVTDQIVIEQVLAGFFGKDRLTAEDKPPRAYREASRDLAKRKRLLQVCDKNPSLALFVRRLEALAAPPPPEAPPE